MAKPQEQMVGGLILKSSAGVTMASDWMLFCHKLFFLSFFFFLVIDNLFCVIYIHNNVNVSENFFSGWVQVIYYWV